jgi:putative ABC transport system ATP-binding protein
VIKKEDIMSLLQIENVSFAYGKALVLEDINFSFERGKIYSIIGKSGAGKTTLLSLLSGLTCPKGGKILYKKNDIKNIDRYQFRSKYVGVIFQNFNLLTNLTAVENVVLSLDISKTKMNNKKGYAQNLLYKVGLNESEANRRVLKLSGGQQQRVAIARALSYNPDIILADEPTGNLDIDTQNEIMNIFQHLAYSEGKCVIIVTHSHTVSKGSDIIYELHKIDRTSKQT